jgi:hypothetical protein
VTRHLEREGDQTDTRESKWDHGRQDTGPCQQGKVEDSEAAKSETLSGNKRFPLACLVYYQCELHMQRINLVSIFTGKLPQIYRTNTKFHELHQHKVVQSAVAVVVLDVHLLAAQLGGDGEVLLHLRAAGVLIVVHSIAIYHQVVVLNDPKGLPPILDEQRPGGEAREDLPLHRKVVVVVCRTHI